MSNLTGASATPQPNRNPDSVAKLTRNQQESEKWDDLLAIIYNDTVLNDTTSFTATGTANAFAIRKVIVPCPVPCRLELTAYWSPSIGSSSNANPVLGVGAAVLKGGIPQAQVSVSEAGTTGLTDATHTAFMNVAVDGVIDVAPGVYECQAIAELTAPFAGTMILGSSGLTVRRGRKPIT